MLVSGYNQDAKQPGILIYEADNGKIRQTGAASGVFSPSYCQIAGSKMYAASEAPDHGGLAVYTLQGGVPDLDDQTSFDDAAGTCFVLAHDHQAGFIYGADYNSGSVCMSNIDENGNLVGKTELIQHEGHSASRMADDPHFDRQRSAHVHTLSFVPNTNLIAAVDLGLDLIVLYETDETGQIVESANQTFVNEVPGESSDVDELSDSNVAHVTTRVERTLKGDEGRAVAELPIRPAGIVEVPIHYGPRIVAYHPTEPLVALICELGCKVLLYKVSDDGLKWTLHEEHDLINGAPNIGSDGKPPLSAHCEFSSDGRFLYTSTRGTDQLIVFALDGIHLVRIQTCSCEGDTPRHFALNHDGSLLAVANQVSDNVSLFRRDAATGMLEMLDSALCEIHPSCIIWE